MLRALWRRLPWGRGASHRWRSEDEDGDTYVDLQSFWGWAGVRSYPVLGHSLPGTQTPTWYYRPSLLSRLRSWWRMRAGSL